MQVRIESAYLRAQIKPSGAELCSLQTAYRQELLWQADPTVWPRHAPLLFPIVGRLNNDELIHQGKHYPLGQHGFARDMEFEVLAQEPEMAAFLLRSNEASRKSYPFEFELEVRYQLNQNELLVSYQLSNKDSQPLYASIGAHPALRWPLNHGDPKEEYEIAFELPESAPISQLEQGLINGTLPCPVQDQRLWLNDELFTHDALIFTQHRSRKLHYRGPGPVSIEMEFDDFPHLGIWTKPGAEFICLEPWQGHADKKGEIGEFKEKPGVVELAIGEQRRWQYSIRVSEV